MNAKRGFTLIELSIVLVIIGLVVGSVTIGAALIRNAEMRNVITDTQAIEIATTTFKNKYGDWPGDLDTTDFFPSATPGNGNGIIYGSEANNVFVHLYLASLIKANPPPSRIASAAYYFKAAGGSLSGNCYCEYVSLPDGSVAGIGRGDPNSFGVILRTASNTAYAFDGAEARSIDSKADDGNAATGKIGIYDTCSSSHTALSYGACSGDEDFPFNYGTGRKNCNMTFWFTGKTGGLANYPVSCSGI